jgi:two-component system cell cycle sensor histidine kinase/response regulator CckA
MILKQLLGKIMTSMGLITRQQLEEALERQRTIFKEKILPERVQRTSLVSEARLATETTPSLGQILIDMGFLTAGQLEEALREQKKTVEVYKLLDSEKLGAAIEMGSIVNSTLNLAEVLALIMRHVNQVTNSAASTLMLIDDTTRELVFSLPTGPKADKLTDIRMPSGKGIAGWVAEDEQPISVPNAKKDPRFYPEIDRISGFETKSVLCVPLKAKTKLIGVLEAINKADGSPFTEEDELLLSVFAYQAAMAIENARLYGELRESEEKYRLLVENANDAIFIAQDQVVKFPNPKAEQMVGYSAGELAETPFVDLIHPEDRDMALDMHRRRLKGEEVPSPCSFRIVRRDGEELWVQLNSVLIAWEGRPATLNLLRDITQQRKLQAQFQAAQRMESLGTLAGGIAHDFNNILMAIQGNASLMLLDLNSSHPYYERLKNIEQSVQSGAELTKELLAFARGGKYEVRPTDLNELIKRSFAMFGRTKKEVTIHTKYQEDLWPARADQGQIEQVLLNLYINAWQAMPGGGELWLETGNVTLDENDVKPYGLRPGNFVKISVTDTGTGMDKKTQERIFDPFFTTKEMGRGTGLGLASVYGIIKNHGGIINVFSKKGEGATFTVYLPASEKEVMIQDPLFPEELFRGTEAILLVDDEDMIIDVGEKILKSLGYKVLVARSGEEAIEIYKKNNGRTDMVILDMIMPEMGGGETYDRMKQINPDIKVLLSSGYSIDGQAAAILERGCDGFIQKPFGIKELSRKIREILDRHNHGAQ